MDARGPDKSGPYIVIRGGLCLPRSIRNRGPYPS